jgi:hypothetical protein
MKKHPHTHTAPYYGGEKMARTLAEAFGHGATLHVPRSRLRKYAPEIVIVVSAVAVVITLLVGP